MFSSCVGFNAAVISCRYSSSVILNVYETVKSFWTVSCPLCWVNKWREKQTLQRYNPFQYFVY